MKNNSRAIFAGGCFWDLEKHFEHLDGVISTRCGYTGGIVPNPTHMEISAGRTGHVHAVEIIFNPAIITFDRLLDIFFAVHNPTVRQSTTPQFRSAIFYTDDNQRRQAAEKIRSLAAAERYGAPILTEINMAGVFYPAAEYHQHYWQKHQHQDINALRPLP